IVSSDAITPESLAMARRGRFSLASARTRAPQVRSKDAGISPREGGGASGETWGRAQAVRASARDATIRLPLVVVDPTVRLDEPDDALLVELLEAVQPCPGGERDPALPARIGRQDHVHR